MNALVAAWMRRDHDRMSLHLHRPISALGNTGCPIMRRYSPWIDITYRWSASRIRYTNLLDSLDKGPIISTADSVSLKASTITLYRGSLCRD